MIEQDARRAVELTARDSYGRLVAMLAARTGDIAAAEDAVGEALLSALRTWPGAGIPDRPVAWLLTVARRTASNVWRHAKVRDAAEVEIQRLVEMDREASPFPDERLKLLFVCAHPAIDPAVRTPLMLQTVLGLNAARIAEAFLVSAATMSQRLVRAKARIRDAGIRFEVPEAAEWPARMVDVLHAIYAAFGTRVDHVAGANDGPVDLAPEALYLGRLLVDLLPDDPEAKGLLALMLYCHARRAARIDAAGTFVPLRAQDTSAWSRESIIEAESLLTTASRSGTFGRFQCEAAIQSVHVHGAVTGRTNHAALDALYRMLAGHDGGTAVRVAQAAARLDAHAPAEALGLLDALPAPAVDGYQPYWVTRAHVILAVGRREDACHALARALRLTRPPSVAAYLRQTLDRWRAREEG